MSTQTKTLRIGALLMVLALVAGACGPATSPTAAPATQAAAPTAAPTLAPEPVELTVWARFPEIEAFLKKIGEKYTAEHPNVTVTVTLFAQRALDEKLAIALPSGEAADLFELDDYGVYGYHKQGLLESLPPDLAEYVRAHVVDAVVTSAADENGAIFTAPLYYYEQTLFINQDQFAEVGLQGCPKTMEELVDFAKKLTKYDANGKVSRSGLLLRLAGGAYGISEKFWALAMIPNGVAPFEKVGSGWRAGYDNEGGQAALQFYLDALYKDKIDSPDIMHDAEGFGLGAGSIFHRESWVVGYLAQNTPDIKYETCLMPKGPKGWGTVFTAGSLSVPAASKNKDVAFDFIKFTLSDENQVLLIDDTGWQPVRKDVDFSSVYAKYPTYETFLTAFNTVGYDPQPYPQLVATNEILGKLAEGLQLAWNNPDLADDPAGVAEAIHRMAEETNRILDSYGELAK